jgi:hypothetical protein
MGSLFTFHMTGKSGKHYKVRAASHRAAWALVKGDRIVRSSAYTRSGIKVPKG